MSLSQPTGSGDPPRMTAPTTQTVTLDEAEGLGVRELTDEAVEGRQMVLTDGGRPVAVVVSFAEMERLRGQRSPRRRPVDPRLAERLQVVLATRSLAPAGDTIGLHAAAEKLGMPPEAVVAPPGGLAQFQ